jgi:hypothetical protein
LRLFVFIAFFWSSAKLPIAPWCRGFLFWSHPAKLFGRIDFVLCTASAAWKNS